MKLFKNNPLLADMAAVDIREYIAEIEATANGDRRAGPRVRLLKQVAYSIETEYGTPPEQLAAEAQQYGATNGHDRPLDQP